MMPENSVTDGERLRWSSHLQTTYHAVFTQNSYIIVYGNGAVNTDFAEICEFNDPQPIYGHAGFGALNNPAGSGSTSDLQIYPISATAPTAPQQSSFTLLPRASTYAHSDLAIQTGQAFANIGGIAMAASSL
ncbi:MAG: hypothetical protein ACR2JB_21310 [Bryobacteraceae bacterium]